MKTHVSIDSAGRVVIPKGVRDYLNLRPGTTLVLEVDSEGVLLKPIAEKESCLGMHDGVLLLDAEHHGPIPSVNDVRHERARKIWGSG